MATKNWTNSSDVGSTSVVEFRNSGDRVHNLLSEFLELGILSPEFGYADGTLPDPPHLSKEQKAAVFKAFDRLGTERMTPVFEALNQEIGYDDLFALRLCYLLEKSSGPDW